MKAEVITQTGTELTIQIKLDISGTLLEAEGKILDACNEVGKVATICALKGFDTDGSPIQIADVKFTAKQPTPKDYETPYGTVEVTRYTYQTYMGGKIYCPLEDSARIIRGATPRFAQMVSHKYSNLNAPAVRLDLAENHHRKIAHSYVQDIADWVGAIASAQEEKWEYTTPKLEEISCIALSLDGAFMPIRDDGYREAMVGAISLYDNGGERQHTIYIGEAPEHGKSTFLERMEREIAQIKKLYPNANYLGVADGSKNNWSFLEQHTDKQILDFYHATEYLAHVAHAAYPRKSDEEKRKTWMSEQCSRLKHEVGEVDKILQTIQELTTRKYLSNTAHEKLLAAQTYFTNNQHRMKYAEHIEAKLPIGSGVTEAACKTLVKQRLCCSGMRWSIQGAKVILSLRALIQSRGRWNQFWAKIDSFGAKLPSR